MSAAPATWQILECLGVVAEPLGTTVRVKAPGLALELTIEQALCRIEEFTEPSQDIILGMIHFIYSIPGFRVMYVTPLERRLVKNMRAMDKVYRETMWEVIDDLAEDDQVYPQPSIAMEST
jgi:hypothetical protein